MGETGATIRIGVAGWDYPDWHGPVYPRGTGGGFDRLEWIARFVDVVEINSSFYRPPAPRTTASWARRTASRERFVFTAKAHRSWTHEIPDDVHADVRATLDGFAPLRDAGRLGALLVQFPHSFHRCERALAHLERLTELAGDWPLVAELRHASWSGDEVRSLFERLELGWCAIDQPQVGPSSLPTLPWVTGRLGYLRLHGRNVRDWFRSEAGRDARYDYCYAPTELDELAGTARAMAAAESAESLFVVQNNHFRGQALVNALQLMAQLGDRAPLAPSGLIAAYPQLAGSVVADQGSLL